jgi:hypothetical protein
MCQIKNKKVITTVEIKVNILSAADILFEIEDLSRLDKNAV